MKEMFLKKGFAAALVCVCLFSCKNFFSDIQESNDGNLARLSIVLEDVRTIVPEYKNYEEDEMLFFCLSGSGPWSNEANEGKGGWTSFSRTWGSKSLIESGFFISVFEGFVEPMYDTAYKNMISDTDMTVIPGDWQFCLYIYTAIKGQSGWDYNAVFKTDNVKLTVSSGDNTLRLGSVHPIDYGFGTLELEVELPKKAEEYFNTYYVEVCNSDGSSIGEPALPVGSDGASLFSTQVSFFLKPGSYILKFFSKATNEIISKKIDEIIYTEAVQIDAEAVTQKKIDLKEAQYFYQVYVDLDYCGGKFEDGYEPGFGVHTEYTKDRGRMVVYVNSYENVRINSNENFIKNPCGTFAGWRDNEDKMITGWNAGDETSRGVDLFPKWKNVSSKSIDINDFMNSYFLSIGPTDSEYYKSLKQWYNMDTDEVKCVILEGVLVDSDIKSFFDSFFPYSTNKTYFLDGYSVDFSGVQMSSWGICYNGVLDSLTLPNSIENFVVWNANDDMPEFLFEGTKMRKLVIPENIKKIYIASFRAGKFSEVEIKGNKIFTDKAGKQIDLSDAQYAAQFLTSYNRDPTYYISR